MDGRKLKVVASVGLAVGGALGMAGTFAPFAIGEGVILSSSAMDLGASVPFFGAGSGLWATALALISLPPVFAFSVRTLGLLAATMFASTALQIFSGIPLTPLSSPLPFFAYPFFVATFAGWIWTLLKVELPRIQDS